MIAAWANHPITLEHNRIIKEKLDANIIELNELIISGPSITNIDLHLVSQVKGQILAYREMLDTKEFLVELTEEEVTNDTESSRSKIAGKG